MRVPFACISLIIHIMRIGRFKLELHHEALAVIIRDRVGIALLQNFKLVNNAKEI